MKFASHPLFLCVVLLSGVAGKSQAQEPLITPQNLKSWLETKRVKYKVPALAVAIVQDGLITTAVTGFRKQDDTTPAEKGDAFHLGSCTKSMTAVVLAHLVDEGKLKWDSTLAEVFPELKEGMRPEFCDMPVRTLLNQRSGFANRVWPDGYGGQYFRGAKEPMMAQRLLFTKALLAQSPSVPVGSQYIYSNANYIIGGAIAEKITGKPWETLIQELVFAPLDMKSAGFGSMVEDGKIDGIWGHSVVDDKLVPKAGEPSDNPAMLGPAGTVHCSIGDWAKYIAFVLRETRGEDTSISAPTFASLITPPTGTNYAFGWLTAERAWGGGTVLQHSGSNMRNYCSVWMSPRRNFAVLVATNAGNGDTLCNEVQSVLLTQLGKTTKQ